MPLVKSSSKRAFKENVSEMVKSGHPLKQALAAAYSTKRKAKGENSMKGKKSHHHEKAAHHMEKAAHHHKKAKHHMERAKHEAKERKLIGKLAKMNQKGREE